MSHKILRPFIVKVSVLGVHFPLYIYLFGLLISYKHKILAYMVHITL